MINFIFYICRTNSNFVEQMQLTNAEEQLMAHLWELEEAYMKDLLEQYADPKPATTTVATLLKRMTEKGFVGYKETGNARKYHALVSRNAYFSRQVKGMVKQFFNNSASQFASFLTTETNLSSTELNELRNIIDKEIRKKQ